MTEVTITVGLEVLKAISWDLGLRSIEDFFTSYGIEISQDLERYFSAGGAKCLECGNTIDED